MATVSEMAMSLCAAAVLAAVTEVIFAGRKGENAVGFMICMSAVCTAVSAVTELL